MRNYNAIKNGKVFRRENRRGILSHQNKRPRGILLSRRNGRRGILLLGVLLLVVLLGYAIMSAWSLKSTEVRREREGDLAFKLAEMRTAFDLMRREYDFNYQIGVHKYYDVKEKHTETWGSVKETNVRFHDYLRAGKEKTFPYPESWTKDGYSLAKANAISVYVYHPEQEYSYEVSGLRAISDEQKN